MDEIIETNAGIESQTVEAVDLVENALPVNPTGDRMSKFLDFGKAAGANAAMMMASSLLVAGATKVIGAGSRFVSNRIQKAKAARAEKKAAKEAAAQEALAKAEEVEVEVSEEETTEE